MRWRDFSTRMAFGAGVSLVASVVGLLAGARVGGLFLACPAILPATLTLLERKEGKDAAEQDEHGAIGGALGLVAFAGAGVLLVPKVNVLLALGLATIAWLLTALSVHWLHEEVHKRARDRLSRAHRG